jgi:hypothetical protein
MLNLDDKKRAILQILFTGSGLIFLAAGLILWFTDFGDFLELHFIIPGILILIGFFDLVFSWILLRK